MRCPVKISICLCFILYMTVEAGLQKKQNQDSAKQYPRTKQGPEQAKQDVIENKQDNTIKISHLTVKKMNSRTVRQDLTKNLQDHNVNQKNNTVTRKYSILKNYPHVKRQDSLQLEPRQLGPIGLTVLGALTLPILIPVGVARLVSRLTNLGNSTSSTGVTVRPVILPSNPLLITRLRNLREKYKRKKNPASSGSFN